MTQPTGPRAGGNGALEARPRPDEPANQGPTYEAARESDSRHDARSPEKLDRLTATLLIISASFYGAQIVLAIAAHRHLFGDAAWFLVKVLAEGRVTPWYSDFWREFYRSRWFAYHLTQWPILAASAAGVTDLLTLSSVFGWALFGHKLLSLGLCWLWLRDKRLFFFPLASLFAGSINAEVYVITESHFLVSLFWPLFVLLMWGDLSTRGQRAGLVLLSVPTLLAYESFAFLGPFLLLATVWRFSETGSRLLARLWWAALGSYYFAGIALAWTAILWPRDALNRGTFIGGLAAALALGHYELVASLWFLVTVPVCVLLWPGHRRVATVLLSGPLLVAIGGLGRLIVQPTSVNFESHIYARVVNLLAPLVLASLATLMFVRGRPRWSSLVLPMRAVAVLGVVQCLWAIGATALWSNMVAALKMELAQRQGLVRFEDTVLAAPSYRGMPMRGLHAGWPLLPLSIVLAGQHEVTTLVFADTYPFAPFDPVCPDQLPKLDRYGVRYDSYVRSLGQGTMVDFRPGGNGWAFERGGWWSRPDAWGTWTDGRRAVVRLPAPEPTEGGVSLDMMMGAFVHRAHPQQRVVLRVNGRSVQSWVFRDGDFDGGPRKFLVAIPPAVIAEGKALTIEFELPDAASPRALGLSEDPRQLGLGMVRLSVRPMGRRSGAPSE